MVKVTLIYLNNEIKEHEPNTAEVTDGMLIMDWPKKRVLINTINLAWVEIDDLT